MITTPPIEARSFFYYLRSYTHSVGYYTYTKLSSGGGGVPRTRCCVWIFDVRAPTYEEAQPTTTTWLAVTATNTERIFRIPIASSSAMVAEAPAVLVADGVQYAKASERHRTDRKLPPEGLAQKLGGWVAGGGRAARTNHPLSFFIYRCIARQQYTYKYGDKSPATAMNRSAL